MQSITTKYLCATNSRGERVKATTSSGISNTISWDYSISENIDNHINAVHYLNKKLNWGGEMAYGGFNNNDGYTFVFIRETINLIKEVK